MASIPHYLRLKPKSDLLEDQSREYLIESQTSTQVRLKDTIAPNKFTKVFSDQDSQATVYSETLKDITLNLFEGQDGVLFTLGPSNSGKSYTILGNISNPGISIYSLNDIFNKIGNNFANHKALRAHFGESFVVSAKALPNREEDGQYAVSLSVFEIYNDKIRDLSLDPTKTQNQSLDIVTDSKDGKIRPSKIRQIYVSHIDDAKLVLHKSIKRRAVSSTSINGKSSRSHLFIHLNLHKVIGKSVIRTTRLTIADLAGSERSKAARTEGRIFKEGNYTNQSLTELGRCLTMMQSARFDSSVLRTSKLTRLLLTDLFRNPNPHNKLKILLALDPYSDLSTILHTLRYIQPVSKVPLSERSSMELSHESLQINKLVEEVESLRKINQILEKKDGISEDKVLEIEMELRQELSEEYEKRIQELDMIHAKALNSLKESNIKSNDDRLKALSEDYEQRVKEIKEELEQNIEHLNEQNKVLTKENEKLSNESQKHHKAANKVTKLQEEIEFLKKSNLETEQILISDITEVRRQNEELEKKLEAVQSELISLEKKDKKRTKKMTELNSQLDEAQKKRKSDADDEFSTFKRNKIIAEVDDYDSNFDQEESELTSFSPIVLSQSQLMSSSPEKRQFKVPMAVSPSKTFNTVEKPVFPNSVSPKKTKSPSSKGLNSGKTPLRKVLKEVNFDLSTATRLKKSPLKSPLKSPSKKKKVRPGFMIEADDSF